MNGIAGVMARIQTIESQIGQVAPARLPVLGAGTATVAAPASAGGASGASATALGGQDLFAKTLAALDLGTAAAPVSSTARLSQTAPASAEDTSGLLSTSITADQLIDRARTYLGVPYVWGGETSRGLDCSGLVQRSLADLGVDIKRTAAQQGTEGRAVATMDDALPGDLLIFDGGTHVGIYLGDGRMIDAPYAGRNVTERDVYETPTAIRRILPQTDQTTVAASAASAAAALPTALAGTTATSETGLSADVQRMALDMLMGASA